MSRNEILKIAISFLFIFLISGCTVKPIADAESIGGDDLNSINEVPDANITKDDSFESVEFETEDGYKIVGNFWKGNEKAVVLLHQFQTNKDTYLNLGKKLNDANFTVIAIDFRGHGESVWKNGEKIPYANFSDADFVKMILDVKAVKKFLLQEGHTLYAIVGASIGANTALNYADLDTGVKKVVLLSPGMEYKGIQTESSAKSVDANVLIIASEEDTYSYGSSKALDEFIKNSEFRGLRNVGHGTQIFTGTRQEDRIVDWLLG